MMRTLVLAASVWTGVVSLVSAEENIARTTLEKVKGCPEAYDNVLFEVDLVFRGLGDIYNPFYTLFEPSTHVNFSAWAASTPMWTREGYLAVHPLFYVDRENAPLRSQMINMPSFTYITVQCIVRSSMADQCWIEVMNITDEQGQVHPDDLQHLARGWVHIDQGNLVPAVAEFDSVKYQRMPRSMAQLSKTEQARYALGLGYPNQALAALRMASRFGTVSSEMAHLQSRANEMVKSQTTSSPVAAASQPVGQPVAMPVETPEESEPQTLTEWPDEGNDDASESDDSPADSQNDGSQNDGSQNDGSQNDDTNTDVATPPATNADASAAASHAENDGSTMNSASSDSNSSDSAGFIGDWPELADDDAATSNDRSADSTAPVTTADDSGIAGDVANSNGNWDMPFALEDDTEGDDAWWEKEWWDGEGTPPSDMADATDASPDQMGETAGQSDADTANTEQESDVEQSNVGENNDESETNENDDVEPDASIINWDDVDTGFGGEQDGTPNSNPVDDAHANDANNTEDETDSVESGENGSVDASNSGNADDTVNETSSATTEEDWPSDVVLWDDGSENTEEVAQAETPAVETNTDQANSESNADESVQDETSPSPPIDEVAPPELVEELQVEWVDEMSRFTEPDPVSPPSTRIDWEGSEAPQVDESANTEAEDDTTGTTETEVEAGNEDAGTEESSPSSDDSNSDPKPANDEETR